MRKNSDLINLLAMGVFGITNTEMGIVGILPNISKLFGVSIGISGLLVSGFALMVTICGPFLPPLVTKFDSKNIIILSLTVFLISNLISAFTKSFTVLLIARLLPAMFHPIYVSLAFTLATQLSPNLASTTRATAKIFVGVSAGMVMSVPLTIFLTSYLGFSAAMLAWALINGANLLATFIFFPKIKRQLTPGNFFQQLKKSNNSYTMLAVITIIVLHAGIFGFYTYMSTFLTSISRLNSNWLATALLIYGLANILGNILAGHWLGKYTRMVFFSLPLALICGYGLLFIFSQILGMILTLSLFLGILTGMAANVTQFIAEQALPKTPELANGLFLSGTNLGTTLGSFVCGTIIAFSDASGAIVGAIVFLLLTVGLILLVVRD